MHTFLETLSENAQFVLLCLGITAGVLLLAWVSEKLVMRRRHRLNAAHTITTIAMLAAISGVLMVIEIPLFFAPSFYKLDFSELPVLICAFYLGPVSGVVCEFLKVLIKLLLKGTSTAFVGDLANFLVGCSFVLPAAIVYQKTLSKKGAVVSLAVGTAVMTVFGSFFNAWFLIPRFAVMYGMPLEAIVSMGTQINGAITNLSTLVLFAVVPFNLLKGVLVSLLLTAALCLCQLLGRGFIVSAFKLDKAAVAICDQHLLASALTMPIFAIYFPANGMFQGVGEGFFATFCALLALGLRVVFAYCLYRTAFGYTAIWWSQGMAWTLTLITCYTHFFRGKWKQKSLVR